MREGEREGGGGGGGGGGVADHFKDDGFGCPGLEYHTQISGCLHQCTFI